MVLLLTLPRVLDHWTRLLLAKLIKLPKVVGLVGALEVEPEELLAGAGVGGADRQVHPVKVTGPVTGAPPLTVVGDTAHVSSMVAGLVGRMVGEVAGQGVGGVVGGIVKRVVLKLW